MATLSRGRSGSCGNRSGPPRGRARVVAGASDRVSVVKGESGETIVWWRKTQGLLAVTTKNPEGIIAAVKAGELSPGLG